MNSNKINIRVDRNLEEKLQQMAIRFLPESYVESRRNPPSITALIEAIGEGVISLAPTLQSINLPNNELFFCCLFNSDGEIIHAESIQEPYDVNELYEDLGAAGIAWLIPENAGMSAEFCEAITQILSCGDNIGHKKIIMVNDETIEALQQAYWRLQEDGAIASSNIILSLLQNIPGISATNKEFFQYLSNKNPETITKIKRFIAKKQPFQLINTSATGVEKGFSVFYAQIGYADEKQRHQYLKCWCDEPNEEGHNWTFRLDRINNSSVEPIEGRWRQGLEMFEVTMLISDKLSKYFEPRSNDTIISRSEEGTIIKRKVDSIFWFLRDISVYGSDLTVISPSHLTQQIYLAKLEEVKNYQRFAE